MSLRLTGPCVVMGLLLTTSATVSGQEVQVVEIPTRDGHSLGGRVYGAAVGSRSYGALLLNMCSREHFQDEWQGLASELRGRGLVVLTYDYRGTGTSASKLWNLQNEAQVRQLTELLSPDAEDAFQYLRTEVERVVAIVGGSCGGSLALDLAATNPEVRRVAVLSGGANDKVSDYLRSSGSAAVLGIASRDDAAALDATRDAVSRASHAESSMITLDNAGHGTRMLGAVEGLSARIADWIVSEFAGAAQETKAK
ncbi:MAG: alpha/beta fold hydrolase [Gemmatimonadota bacterium]